MVAPEVLCAEMSCEAALGVILRQCGSEIDRHLAVFLNGEDVSGPHKTRVALRRLTTALDAFTPILRRKPTAVLRAEAKAIFRALGRVRDADVFLMGQLEPDAEISRETMVLRAEVRADLRARKAVAFVPALLRQLGEDLLRFRPKGRAARARPLGEFVTEALDRAWARGLLHGADAAGFEGEALHEFRKDMKTLRYLAEFFAPLWPDSDWPGFRRLLQKLQDELGRLNDLANARARGREIDMAREAKARAKAEAAWREMLALGPFWHAAVFDAPTEPSPETGSGL